MQFSSRPPFNDDPVLRSVEVFQKHNVMSASPDQIEHARRVLALLANLTKE